MFRFTNRCLLRYNLKQVEHPDRYIITKLSGCNDNESIRSLNAPSSIYSNVEESQTQERSENVEHVEIQENREHDDGVDERNAHNEVETNPENEDETNPQNEDETNPQNEDETNPHNEDETNPDCDKDSDTSEGSITTEPEYSIKYQNIFRMPQRLSNEKIQNLLHCSKKQFNHYVESLRPHMKGREDFLSIHSRVFLFRFKVMPNKN